MRVFLSSTAVDLAEHRQVADDTLLRLQQQPVVMERFGALPGAPVDECERLAASAACGYRLKEVELLVTRSAIHLARPDAGAALADARQALDLATAPDCGDAWGEADATHAWGQAFEALGEHDHARRAYAQALAVRERIEHPGAPITQAALQRLG